MKRYKGIAQAWASRRIERALKWSLRAAKEMRPMTRAERGVLFLACRLHVRTRGWPDHATGAL